MIEMHSIEAEMSALGAMLLSPDRAAEDVGEILTCEDFYQPSHGLIFQSMRRLMSKRVPIDVVTLEDDLKMHGALADSGGANYLLELANYTPSASNSNDYAKIVKDKSTLRRLDASAREVLRLIHDEEITDVTDKVEKAERLMFEVGRSQTLTAWKSSRELAKEFFVELDAIVEDGIPMQGQKVGFYDLDDVTSGFYPGDLVVVGARPAMGKTSLALDFAVNVATEYEGKEGATAIFSIEMSEKQLIRRMASMLSGVSMSCLKTGKVSDDDYRRLSNACETLYSVQLHIDDSSDITIQQMRGRCRRLMAQHGKLNLIIVDYLQLVKPWKRTGDPVYELGDISRGLKQLGKEFLCPVVALAQLNRGVESRDNKRPSLSDIKGSGSIEAESDIVLLLYRESYYKPKDECWTTSADDMEEAEIIIAKHRNGRTGTVKLGFQPAYTRYRNIARGDQ